MTVRGVRAYAREAPTRMPFRFGAATLTGFQVAYLRASLESEDGGRATGVSASVLSPLWFDKDASKSLEERTRNLLLAVRAAVDAARAAGPSTALELHAACEAEARASAAALGLPELVAAFGGALVDGAVVDGLCRLADTTFHAGLQGDLFGFGDVPDLPGRPLDSIAVRHTVGLADPLVAADVAARLDDGLPETLEEVARGHGCSWFKVKVSNDVDATLERLARIADVLERESPDYRMTVDANESFADAGELEELVRRIEDEPALTDPWRRTAWIEQPLAREAALADAVAAPISRIGKPIVLDESDATDDVVERGLALGYRGISAKNAKGVFRTLHSARTIHGWNACGAGAVLSSEDLTNTPVVALHQDLAVAAALGIPHTERNAHHYVRGLDLLTEGERETALAEFPGLYERRADGPVSLRIDAGRISTAEINGFGYGVRSEPEWDALVPLDLPDPREDAP